MVLNLYNDTYEQFGILQHVRSVVLIYYVCTLYVRYNMCLMFHKHFCYGSLINIVCINIYKKKLSFHTLHRIKL